MFSFPFNNHLKHSGCAGKNHGSLFPVPLTDNLPGNMICQHLNINSSLLIWDWTVFADSARSVQDWIGRVCQPSCYNSN